jgi:hypothetical protein
MLTSEVLHTLKMANLKKCQIKVLKGVTFPHGNSFTFVLVLVLYCGRTGTLKSINNGKLKQQLCQESDIMLVYRITLDIYYLYLDLTIYTLLISKGSIIKP